MLSGAAVAARTVDGKGRGESKRRVYLVPNFHPASCGWLTTFSKERMYCANSYLNQLDRVRDDPNYEFAMSEVNNIIAIMDFQPQRISELKERIRQKRVELVNAYFLESTINLSGGEALMRLGVEGLRWYGQVFGLEPRFSWNIDTCGAHEQMPQIATELGLKAFVYTRKNPTGKTIFWSVSPDGSKILTLCPGHYAEASEIFKTKQPLTAAQLEDLGKLFDGKEAITPAQAPILVLAGSGDYSLAPVLKSYPTQFLKQWKQAQTGRRIGFSTLGKYFDAIEPHITSGEIQIPTFSGGTDYSFDAFWIENPRVKTLYRRNEQALQATEILATAASLKADHAYPVDDLYRAWILMCLNMDRNTLWGSAGGMVFVDPKSWDVQDRFDWVERTTAKAAQSAGRALLGSGSSFGTINPLNWTRTDPAVLHLPAGMSIEGAGCEAMPGGAVLCELEMGPVRASAWSLSSHSPRSPESIALPHTIETDHYSVRIDARTGAIVSLKWKPGNREILSAPANVIVAERPAHTRPNASPGDFMPARPERTRLTDSNAKASAIDVVRGPVATTVTVSGTFYGGGTIRRTMHFYHRHPRIDLETELNDIPNFTVVVAEFPLAEEIADVRRGIPFGFSHSRKKGIVPAIRWIDYELSNGGGFAILDRGCTGRELDGRIPIIYLLNAEDKYYGYPNPWLSGKGRDVLQYSLIAHPEAWADARIPQRAWEYNCAPIELSNCASHSLPSFVETSANLILEALRREDDHLEMRLVESVGAGGTARIKLNLPHESAALSDALGRTKSVLKKGPEYVFAVRPQQIVTLRFKAASSLPIPPPVKTWNHFVPKDKLSALHAYNSHLIGHPPSGG
ncbi:MAG TPA: glycoside hydrolase family 38 C-terminal domain-containing protein [Bryobacteraceae bacterium]